MECRRREGRGVIRRQPLAAGTTELPRYERFGSLLSLSAAAGTAQSGPTFGSDFWSSMAPAAVAHPALAAWLDTRDLESPRGEADRFLQLTPETLKHAHWHLDRRERELRDLAEILLHRHQVDKDTRARVRDAEVRPEAFAAVTGTFDTRQARRRCVAFEVLEPALYCTLLWGRSGPARKTGEVSISRFFKPCLKGVLDLLTQELVELSRQLDEEESKTDGLIKQVRRLNERQLLARPANRRRGRRSSSSGHLSSTPSSTSIMSFP